VTGQLCTGCDRFLYTEDSGPCPNCFPGLERTQAEEEAEEIMDGYMTGHYSDHHVRRFGSPS
jgi:hypothetical protein